MPRISHPRVASSVSRCASKHSDQSKRPSSRMAFSSPLARDQYSKAAQFIAPFSYRTLFLRSCCPIPSPLLSPCLSPRPTSLQNRQFKHFFSYISYCYSYRLDLYLYSGEAYALRCKYAVWLMVIASLRPWISSFVIFHYPLNLIFLLSQSILLAFLCHGMAWLCLRLVPNAFSQSFY